MFRLAALTISLSAVVACSSTPDTSTKGQLITCETDSDDGTILSCQPTSEDDDDDDPDECQDVDEDGDGTPHDEPGDEPLARTSPTEGDDDTDDDDCSCDGDEDDDGVPDDDDCDEQPGGDDDDAELPYDIKMSLGETYRPILDAFAEKGGQPQAILSIVMDGGGTGWRMAELQAASAFTITQADCDHAGNRDVGRDRVLVTWRKADGSSETDHLDLRYCEE